MIKINYYYIIIIQFCIMHGDRDVAFSTSLQSKAMLRKRFERCTVRNKLKNSQYLKSYKTMQISAWIHPFLKDQKPIEIVQTLDPDVPTIRLREIELLGRRYLKRCHNPTILTPCSLREYGLTDCIIALHC